MTNFAYFDLIVYDDCIEFTMEYCETTFKSTECL